MSTNNDLNSALALFQSLYKAQKGDIYTIIERFILVGVKSKGLMSFTKEDIAGLLKELFNVEIPFSVIQKCIISNQQVFKYTREKYVVINPMDEEIDTIISEMNETEAYKDCIGKDLLSFVEAKKETTLDEVEKDAIKQLFFDFVIDKERVDSDGNSDKLLVSEFIIQKEQDEKFQRYLNSIREGMVIYKGIRYSESPNDTSWEINTDFFLDQEHLFSAYGMNGPFYEKCFFEFWGFVEEINKVSKWKGGRDRIRLYYFPETKSDIDSYFAQAIRIRRMQERYNYPQVAMDNILNSCKEDIDIERYKTSFYRRLKELKIEEYDEEIDLRRNKDYLLENEALEKEKEKIFTPDQYSEVNHYLKIADYINILREGKRGTPYEKCRFMFLSEGKLSNDLSRLIRDYYSENKPVLITRMGTFTELMWFKLRKGVVGTDSSATISVVNKAKTVVSGLLYDNLKKQYDSVLALDADENEKKAYYADLRTKRYSPDLISSETIAEDVAFIDDPNYLEKYKQTQDLLKKQAAKTVELEKELDNERQSNKDLKAQLSNVLDYVAKDEKRKMSLALVSGRRRIFPIRFILKHMVVIINLFVIAAFIIPSWSCMEVNWVNIATVGGAFVTVEGLLNGYLIKSVPRRKNWFKERYKKVLKKEMINQGFIEK